jgi:hypothetical protein
MLTIRRTQLWCNAMEVNHRVADVAIIHVDARNLGNEFRRPALSICNCWREIELQRCGFSVAGTCRLTSLLIRKGGFFGDFGG